MPFERPGPGRSYFFSKRDLLELERFAWYVNNKDVPRLEEQRMKLGNASVSSWICSALNEWIGFPQGLPTSPEDIQRTALDSLERAIPKDATDAPYWGIFETDVNGNLTGRIWMREPGKIPLFRDRSIADQALKTVPPPDGEETNLGRTGAAWQVRGLTQDVLRKFEREQRGQYFSASLNRKGKIVLEPLK